MRDFIGKGLTTNVNIVNILRVLLENKNNEIYIPYDYVVESSKNSDTRVHFYPKESGRPLRVMNIQGHSERFNVSMTCLCDVKVEFETDQGVELRDKKVWRSFNIIRDGKLTMCKLLAKLDEESYNDLLFANDILYLDEKKITPEFKYDNSLIYTIRLSPSLPIVSSNWARPIALGFPGMMLKSQHIQEDLKVLRKYIKDNMILTSSNQNSEIYAENVNYSKVKIGKDVDCVVYSVKDNYQSSLSFDPETILDTKAKLEKELADLKFRCFCIKWACEKSKKKNSFEFTELKQKRKNSPKYYQEAVLSDGDKRYVVERCQYTKSI